MKRRGFAYIIAVLILGLLAFMGLFLMQSSSAEYSQAAMFTYHTMAFQIAESAADEAFLLLEREFQNDTATGKKLPLLRQAMGAEFPENGGTTGINPTLLDILPNLKDYCTQTKALIDYHVTKAGFNLESVAPRITDMRPIDYGPIQRPGSMYVPKDRQDPFDTKMSRDFYLSLGFDVKVSLKRGMKKRVFQYSITRDMKVINVGPIARNYTMFSCFGVDVRNQSEIMNDLSRGNGRLVLWNNPFQSRLYIHGPAVMKLENPDFLVDRANLGAYSVKDPDGRPGVTQAYQYSKTFNGLSYFPFPARALWETKRIFTSDPNGTMGEFDDNLFTEDEKRMYGHNTYIKGFIPQKDRTNWEIFKDFMSSSDYMDYVRGSIEKQRFLPAGPFCRFPWQFVPDREPSNYAPNQIAEQWPKTDSNLRIEHRYIKGDDTLSDSTKIYSEVYKTRLIKVAGMRAMQVGHPMRQQPEFSLSYGNHRDPEGAWETFKAALGNLGLGAWRMISAAPKLIYAGGEALVRGIFGTEDPTVGSTAMDQDHRNFYPTNFKLFYKAATLKLKDVDEIPKDANNVWLLNGVYWLDSFETKAKVVYKGKGMIFVGKYIPDKPFTIGGDMIAFTNPDGSCDSHLTLVYHPWATDPSTGAKTFPPMKASQMEIRGSGRVIEACVYSMNGIRTTSGTVTDANLAAWKLDPAQPTAKWAGFDRNALHSNANFIYGNYVNYFINKSRLDGDLWVVHNTKSPMYFDQTNPNAPQIKKVYTEADEAMAHSVLLSPKIQHVCYTGAS